MQLPKESPEYVSTSLAGAMSLGLERGKFLRQTKCGCLNLLLTYAEGCRANCSYCGLAGNRKLDATKTFIRVKWPTYSLEEILKRVQNGNHPFKRVCVSMITNPRALDDTLTVIRQVREQTGLPVSGLLAPTVMRGKPDLEAVKAAGADRVGIAVDAATPELFFKHRGAGVKGPHRWERFWQSMAEAVEVFGRYQVGVHLIVGMGETEQDMAKVISKAYEMGVLTHLFSFFPEAGSLAENLRQPPLDQYRRVQLATHLLNSGVISFKDMSFSSDGQITGFGIDPEPYLQSGLAFMTTGCPGADGQVACNRPFGNERASEPLRNFPFRPEAPDIQLIRTQIWNGVKVNARN